MLYRPPRVLLSFLFLAILLAVGATAHAQAINKPYVAGEIIVKFKENVTEAQRDAVLADLGAYDVQALERIDVSHGKISSTTTVGAIERYQGSPLIEYIEPNYTWTINEIPDDPRFDELYGMLNTGQTGGTAGADISATSAWDVFTGSSDVVIGVIDTGVDYNHPDLAANMWTNPGEIPDNGIDDDGNGFIDDVYGWDFVNNDNDPMDDNGHGSHCSGTIGGVGDNGIGVAGVNWNVSIMALKFLDAGGSGSTAAAIEAVEYATMMGVRLTSNSWGGGGFSQALYDAIADAQANGILFAAAAGNSGSNNDVSPHYPSNYDLDNIVSVAATNHNDALASFSSYGATTVDLAAPGVDILSTLPGGSYGELSGTSMATPHVAGALGLIFGRFPAIGGADAKSLLLNFVDPIAELDGVVLTGGRLNAFMPIADPDSIPPAQITDLAVVQAGSNWLDLQWSAVGDDDYTGEASRYEVRYSDSPIDDANWDAAMVAYGAPDPGSPGTLETMRLDGLDFNSNYYVAVKAMDEFGNASPASNSPMGSTLGAPDIAATPLSLSDALLTGGTSYQTVTLSNVGEGTLDFVIPTPTLIGSPVTTNEWIDLPKGVDDRIGQPVTEAAGGPDMFGYRWIDSNDALGPVFAWADISSIGTVALATGDDETAGPFPLSFSFPFYGGDHNEFYVCSNGFISLSDDAAPYSNQQLPNSGAPSHLIAPFWDDLVVDPGTVYYYDDGSRLIVQWEGVVHYGEGGPYQFQAILNGDGSIIYQYNAMSVPTNSATLGVQNGDGSDGMQVAYNTDYVADGLAVRIWAVPQWLTVAPVEGTVWAGGSAVLDVTFDASGLVGGDYDGVIRVVSNDPDEPDYEVPVTLAVTGAPDIAVNPTMFAFSPLFLGASETTQVMVRNVGTDVLTIAGIAIDEPVFSADQNAFVLNPGATQIVNVTFTPLLAQAYSGNMTIMSDDPSDPNFIVALSGDGMEPPQFSVNPTSLASALYTGESEQQILTFTNDGGSDFIFDLGVVFDAEVTVHEYVELGKDDVDARVGAPVTLGQGGPDLYGYRWIDSDEPGGPAFDWVDISTTGTPVFTGTADDRNESGLPIGFDFSFYGNTYNAFNVCSNGFISFTSTSTSYSNQLLPNSGAPENIIAPFWDDLRIDTSTGANVFYEYDGTRLIIQYHRVPKYFATGEATFQVILGQDGSVLIQYETMTGLDVTSATVGIQNDARDDGLTVAFNTAYIHDGLAVRLQAFPEWLSVSPTTGVVPPGASMPITAQFNAEGLFGGHYEADIMVGSNDPSVPQLPVPATLDVTGAPDLALSTMAFDFGQNFLGTPTLQNLVLANTGTDDLLISEVLIDNAAFSTQLTAPVELGPTQTAVVTVGFLPTAVGTETGTMTIVSNDPDLPEAVIDLTGVGVEPPEASVDPTALAADLFTGEFESQTLTLTNSGQSDLTFLANTLLGASEPTTVYAAMELGKDDTDPRPGILGSGGPDLYGYRWKDSDEPGGPLYQWTDIAATGTPVFASASDDGNEGPFAIGFAFPFYGTAFGEINICSNGWLSFTNTTTDYSNDPLPNSGAPENLIAPFWDDLRVAPTDGNNVYYEYDGDKFIVQYDQVPRLGSGGPYTFQVHLYPNGTIMYYYNTMAGDRLDEATIGLQNATRDDGLTVAYNAEYVHDAMAIRLAPISDWLTVTPAEGTVPAGASEPLTVTFNADELFGGVYEGAVRLQTNDPLAGLLEVPAVLTVTGVPVAAAEPVSLDFGQTFVGYPDQLVLTVSNVGTDLLTVSGITCDKPDYTFSIVGAAGANPLTFELDPFESQDVLVTFDPRTGDRAGTISIASNDAGSPLLVPVSGSGVLPPVAAVLPAEGVVAAALPGGGNTRVLKIRNNGNSNLEWTLNASESLASDMIIYPELKLDKNDVDPRPGILGAGGPDTFGHEWIDSDEEGGPVFDWVDISAIGTPIFNGYNDDANASLLPIGFEFPFYGNTFTTFNVSTNGWLSFTNTTTDYSNDPLPSAGGPENLLALFWDDMVVDPLDGGEVYYHFDGTRLIVQYEIRRIGQGGNPPFYSMQAILYPNGNIMYQYNQLGTDVTSCTVGIQNGTRDDALMMVYNAEYLHEGLAIFIRSAPSWLSVGTESGIIEPARGVDVDVIMDAAELEAGDHYGTLTLTSNDPAMPTLTVDVTLHVGSVDVTAVQMDPDTLDPEDNGLYVFSRFELPAEYDPMDVVVETVMLNGEVPASPVRFTVDNDFNGNGIPDIECKFNREALEQTLPDGEQVEVVITGEIKDVIFFTAVDTIRVITPTLLTPNGGEVVLTDQVVSIQWDNPEGKTVDHADLYYTLDTGETWEPIATAITTTSYDWTVPLTISEGAKIRVFVYDEEGLLGSDTSDETFIVSNSISAVDDVLPVVYALRGAFPNPFNPKTVIGYDLPKAGRTQLAIYDVRGRLVAKLVDEVMARGRHEVTWFGKDSAGRQMASGVYYYRITSGDFTAVKPMTLVK